MEPKTIELKDGSIISVADLLIYGAHMLSDLVDEGADAEVTIKTTLKNGNRYESKLTVVSIEN